MIELRPYQEQIITDARQAYADGNRGVLMQLATGGGKCLGRGTQVLMFDGTVKAVEDVKLGDVLVGPDSLPRNVLSICTGTEPLYRVIPTKGEPYVVNESHILSLRYTGLGPLATGYRNGPLSGDIVNISVLSYMGRSKTFRHVAKGWRSGVDWRGSENLPIDPYVLGVWLGDGTSSGVGVTTIDPEIESAIRMEAKNRGLEIRHDNPVDRCATFHISGGQRGGADNSFRSDLRRLGLLGNKHIPLVYKTAARSDRLALLAGLLDTDGSLSKTDCLDFVFKSQQLADDTIFIARSLGFAAYRKPCRKTCTNNGKIGDYHRFTVSGGVDEIPARLLRKQSMPRSQKKNVLNVGIKVEPIGEGEYFGFEIDGDHLFLLGDFTVTHNTFTASTIVHGAAEKGNAVWWLCHRRELVAQASETFYNLGIPHGVVKAGRVSDPTALIQVASIQTIVRRMDKLHPPKLIIFDEAHHIGAASWARIFDEFPEAKVLGLTATPWRLDGKGLGTWFSHMVNGPSVQDLINQGSLCDYRLFAPPAPDLSGVGSVAGDYKRGSLAKAMDKPKIVGDAISHYSKLCPGKRAVVFAAGVENSKHIVDQFNEAGIPASHVDGTMSVEERDYKVAMFKSGETLILSNADLFGEGFDVPAIEAAILLRPTKSLSLYLQQCGRALRPMEGKSEAIILDHAGNSLVHGLPNEEREWLLEDRVTASKAPPAVVSIRQCPECFFVYRPAPACPQCGHRPPIEAWGLDHVDGVLEEVKQETRMKKRQQGRAQTLEDLQRVGRERGYKPGWAMMVWRARQSKVAA